MTGVRLVRGSSRRRGSWWSTIGGVGAASILLATSASMSASAAQAEDAGEAVVVAGAGETRRLSEGGSATDFSLRLPRGASCPGDSANDGYRVQSYMVPTTVAPARVGYDGLGPAPNAYGDWTTFRQPLYDTATRPFASAQTAEATAPGRPGAIVNVPTFSFAVYGPGELPPGRYHVGIACTLNNQPVRYWDTKVLVTRSPSDKPAEIRWSVPGFADDEETKIAPSAVAAALAVAIAMVVVLRRRRRRQSSGGPTEEQGA